METPPNGRFRCPTCSSRFFVEDQERNLKFLSDQVKNLRLKIGGTTKFLPANFFKCQRCGWQLPMQAEISPTVTVTFTLKPKNDNEPTKC